MRVLASGFLPLQVVGSGTAFGFLVALFFCSAAAFGFRRLILFGSSQSTLAARQAAVAALQQQHNKALHPTARSVVVFPAFRLFW